VIVVAFFWGGVFFVVFFFFFCFFFFFGFFFFLCSLKRKGGGSKEPLPIVAILRDEKRSFSSADLQAAAKVFRKVPPPLSLPTGQFALGVS